MSSAEHDQDAGAHRRDEAVRHFVLDFRVARGLQRNGRRQLLRLDNLEEAFARHAQRHAAIEIDADHGASLAVEAVDRGRAAAEFDGGNGGERDGFAVPRW